MLKLQEIFKAYKNELRSYTYTNNDFTKFTLWLALIDVARVLDLNKAAIQKFRDKQPEMFQVDSDGTALISERGFFYLVLFMSKTPEAQKFRRHFMLKCGRLTKKVKAQIMNTAMNMIRRCSTITSNKKTRTEILKDCLALL